MNNPRTPSRTPSRGSAAARASQARGSRTCPVAARSAASRHRRCEGDIEI
jgi:hypothetical protein